MIVVVVAAAAAAAGSCEEVSGQRGDGEGSEVLPVLLLFGDSVVHDTRHSVKRRLRPGCGAKVLRLKRQERE